MSSFSILIPAGQYPGQVYNTTNATLIHEYQAAGYDFCRMNAAFRSEFPGVTCLVWEAWKKISVGCVGYALMAFTVICCLIAKRSDLKREGLARASQFVEVLSFIGIGLIWPITLLLCICYTLGIYTDHRLQKEYLADPEAGLNHPGHRTGIQRYGTRYSSRPQYTLSSQRGSRIHLTASCSSEKARVIAAPPPAYSKSSRCLSY